MTPNEKLLAARVYFLRKHPWLAELAMVFPLIPDATVKTMACTNSGKIYYSEDFVKKLPFRHLVGVYAHEVLHIALNHIERGKTRKPLIWNVATDYIVNDIVGNQLHLDLPAGSLHSLLAYTHNAEEIYDILLQHVVDIPENACGTMRIEQMTPDEQKRLAEKIKNALHGKVPASLLRTWHLETPQLNWVELLERWVSNMKNDYEWLKPKPFELINYHYYTPACAKENLSLIIGIDTSGSITNQQLSRFITEVWHLLHTFNISGILVTYDAEIHDIISVEEAKTLQINLRGGGGTDFRPIFKFAEHQNHDGIIILTDGEGEFPPASSPPSIPTLWVLTKDHNVPFGEKVVIND
jgi:predicted metal-dependent peptidase